MEVEVKFSDDGLGAALDRLQGDLLGTAELHQAMAVGVEEVVRGHLLGLNSRSPLTGYYAKASRSVESSWDAAAGKVQVPHAGVALRYYGGRVEMKDRHLALPTDAVPVRGDERLRPGEIPDLAFIPRSEKAAHGTYGYLMEGEKNAKGRLIPKDGGKLMFILRDYTDHAADPAVMPDDATLTLTATEAAEDYLSSAILERGLS